MKRYLQANDEKVFQIMEQQENCTVYIGRVLVSKYGAMVYKEDTRCFLTWEEFRLIQEQQPDA
jgi:uncharacterized protein YutE (UPF0331/DUF86 family)